MNKWLNDLGLSSFVSLDLETTGLDSGTERIIEIGAVRFENGKVKEVFQSFVSPGKRISSFITDLTGITENDLKDAPKFEHIADDFLKFLADDPLVAQNADFDLGFLFEEGNRLKTKPLAAKFSFRDRKVVDTAMIARVFWPELTGFSLSSLTNHFSVPLLKAHRAHDDAQATGELLVKQIEQLPKKCWKEFSDDLLNLIGTTTHRSKFFFLYLAELCKEITFTIETPPKQNKQSVETNLSNLSLKEIYGKDGLLEIHLKNFEYRPIQLQMAEAVEESFESNTVLLMEAPTGTGKSLAYLIPALRWVMDNKSETRQVFVSSSTKTLQDQLFQKDIFEIQNAVGQAVQASVLKGRSNYLCKRRFTSLLEEAESRLSENDRVRLMPLIQWSKLTKTGDISEISGFNPNSQSFLWSQISSDAFACSNALCSAAKGDFHKIAQENAQKANIVFVNHALLLSDFSKFNNKPSPNRKFILDEAHHIERSMVSAMSEELSYYSLRILLNRLAEEKSNRGLLFRLNKKHFGNQTEAISAKASELQSLVKSLHSLTKGCFSELGNSFSNSSANKSYGAKLRYRDSDEAYKKICLNINPLCIIWKELDDNFKSLLQNLSDLSGDDRPSNDLLFEVMSVSESIHQNFELIDSFIGKDIQNSVRWIETNKSSQGNFCKLQISPIDIAENMSKDFWVGVDTAILTSATLTTNRNFTHLKRTLGLNSQENLEVSEISLPSVFPLKEQMRIFAPTYFENPKFDKTLYDQRVIELCIEIVRTANIGTLILCTSLEFADKLTVELTPILAKLDRQLLSQTKSGNPSELLKNFKKKSNSVLIGAQSFWEGVDVVGESLQLLIVTKLPFDVPTDPWFEAKSEMLQQSGFSPFNDFSLPETVLKLKQGIGRLIRHQSDVGIVVITDPRVLQSSYAGYIKKSLPVAIDSFQNSASMIDSIQSFFDTND